jgi:hypothetical protein
MGPRRNRADFSERVKAGFVLGTQYDQGAMVKRNASGKGYYISDLLGLHEERIRNEFSDRSL